jgi:hypothetical protein
MEYTKAVRAKEGVEIDWLTWTEAITMEEVRARIVEMPK